MKDDSHAGSLVVTPNSPPFTTRLLPKAAVPMGPTLKVGEVAAALRLSTATVYKLVASGQLAAVRVASAIRIPKQVLDLYLTQHGTPGRLPATLRGDRSPGNR